jgi:hypothetical protein
MVGAMALVPVPAYALDPYTTALPSALILAAAVLVAVALLLRQRRRIAILDNEKARIAAALAERDAVIAASPAALYLVSPGGEGARLTAGALAGLPGADRFAGLCTLLEPAGRTALETALRRLRSDGVGFELGVRLAADGRAFDVRGSRAAQGELVAVTDGGARQTALGDRDTLRQLLDATPRPIWRRRRSDCALIDCNGA